MNDKKLFNKLAHVAFIITESELVDCDAEIDSQRIRLINWRRGMISFLALRLIMNFCNQFGLFCFVDFDNKSVIIHG